MHATNRISQYIPVGSDDHQPEPTCHVEPADVPAVPERDQSAIGPVLLLLALAVGGAAAGGAVLVAVACLL